MVIGDMPPLLLPGVPAGIRCPRGPFCIPLRTSTKPISASYEPDRCRTDNLGCRRKPKFYGCHTTHAWAAVWEPWTGIPECAVNQHWHAVYLIEINLSEFAIKVLGIKSLAYSPWHQVFVTAEI